MDVQEEPANATGNDNGFYLALDWEVPHTSEEREKLVAQRWDRLALGCLASFELKRAQQWVPETDVITTECLHDVLEKLKCNPAEALDASARERLTTSLRSSVQAYLELYKLDGGSEVRTEGASRVVRLASRLLRDVIAWRCFGLSGMDDSGAFFLELNSAFDGRLSSPGHNDLKAKMSHAWSKERAAVGLKKEKIAPLRRGKKNKKPPVASSSSSLAMPFVEYPDWPPFDPACAWWFPHSNDYAFSGNASEPYPHDTFAPHLAPHILHTEAQHLMALTAR